jgi:hypothetical protein
MNYNYLNGFLQKNNIHLFDFEIRILEKRISNFQEFIETIKNKLKTKETKYCCNYVLEKKGIFISCKHFNKIKKIINEKDNFNIFNWINTTSQHKLFLFIFLILHSKLKKSIYLVYS